MDSWDDVITTNSLDDPLDIAYGTVVNEANCGRSAIARRRIVGGAEAGKNTSLWRGV
jgi:hypothetical protein